MDEIWRPIPGFGDHYEASSMGRIRVKDRIIVKRHSMTGKPCRQFYKGRLLRPSRGSKHGHLCVTLGVDGVDTSRSVHGLVLLAFVGPRPEGMECCHNNGVASDNRVENLRWDTHYNNNQDRIKHGTYANGEAHPMAKLTSEAVRSVRERGLSNRQIMSELGISRSQAQRIRVGESWRNTGCGALSTDGTGSGESGQR